MYVRPSVCPSICFHNNSRAITRRMMKLCTIIVEVKAGNNGFEDGSRTWPLTQSNWRLYILHRQRVYIRQHSVHCTRLTYPFLRNTWLYGLQQFMFFPFLPFILQYSTSIRFSIIFQALPSAKQRVQDSNKKEKKKKISFWFSLGKCESRGLSCVFFLSVYNYYYIRDMGKSAAVIGSITIQKTRKGPPFSRYPRLPKTINT